MSENNKVDMSNWFQEVWNQDGKFRFEEVLKKFSQKNEAVLSIQDIFIFLSRPKDQKDPRDRSKAGLEFILNVIDKTNIPNAEHRSTLVYQILNRVLNLYKNTLQTDYSDQAQNMMAICAKNCSNDMQAVFNYNLAAVVDLKKSTESLDFLTAFNYSVTAFTLYGRSKNVDPSLIRIRQGDALAKSSYILMSCVQRRLKDPRKIKKIISKIRKLLFNYLRKASKEEVGNERYNLLLAYQGLFWLHSHTYLKFFRLHNCIKNWKTAFELSKKNKLYRSLHTTASFIERYSNITMNNPLSHELGLKAEKELDDMYVSNRLYKEYSSYKEAKLLTESITNRRAILKEFIANYAVSSDAIYGFYETYFKNTVKAEILHDKFSGNPFNDALSRQKFMTAKELAGNYAENAMKKLNSSNFIKIISEGISGKAKFGLYLRNTRIESHISAKTRPKSFYFEDCVIENYTASLTELRLKNSKRIRQLEHVLSSYDFISLSNLYNFNPGDGQVHSGFTSDQLWRKIIFSLIGEATVIVVALPYDYDFDVYSGVMEEREQIAFLKKRDQTICVRDMEVTSHLPDELMQKMLFPSNTTKNQKIHAGPLLTEKKSKKDLKSMFPLSTNTKDAYWSKYQFTTDSESLNILPEIFDLYF